MSKVHLRVKKYVYRSIYILKILLFLPKVICERNFIKIEVVIIQSNTSLRNRSIRT